MVKRKIDTALLRLQQLERGFVKYEDLRNIPIKESHNPFVLFPERGQSVIGVYDILNDSKSTFPQIPVRKTVAEKLFVADQQLKKIHPSYQLMVTYGYRSMGIQQMYYLRELEKIQKSNQKISAKTMKEIVHRKIAVPEVAGHPTGGAIDVAIFDRSKASYCDFGTKLYDLKPRSAYTLSPYIQDEGMYHRLLLRWVLMNEQFAPFDGEWWHFSYGDKEWAYFYGKPHAIFTQLSESEVSDMIAKRK